MWVSRDSRNENYNPVVSISNQVPTIVLLAESFISHASRFKIMDVAMESEEVIEKPPVSVPVVRVPVKHTNLGIRSHAM